MWTNPHLKKRSCSLPLLIQVLSSLYARTSHHLRLSESHHSPEPSPPSSRCTHCSCWMEAPNSLSPPSQIITSWPRLTRLQRISHLHLHLCWPGSRHFTHFPKYHNICIQSSEINVGKLANPIFMRPNRAKSKFQLITPRGQLGSSWTVQLVPNFPFRSDILHNYHCFHIRPGGLIMKWHW